jgi:hypothetical protein
MSRSHDLTHPSSPFHPPRLHLRSLAARVAATPWLQRVTLLVLLGLLLWIGCLPLSTPAVTPAGTPATAFSAERALAHLRVIAAEPHPVGSAANADVRQYLIDQVRALGLEPQIQTAASVVSEGAEGFRAGTVSNVIVRVPGTDSSGAIAINAHYDSANTSSGASDAGSGVVTALETLRAVIAGPRLKNDLLVVFVDAEERHMLGSAAFTEQHPWAQDVRLAINYEANGSGGPAFLYVTSKDNDRLVKEFLEVAPNPSAYSLLPTISNLYPDGRFDSDLGEYIREGSQGLGFVYVGRPTDYHTLRDNVENVDVGSIQQEGGYTLALVRHVGNRDLTEMPRSGDRVFFTILPGLVVHYAASWVAVLSALTTALVGGLVVLGLRRMELTAGGLAVATLATAAGTLGAAVLAALLWAAVRAANPHYQVQMVGHYQTSLLIVALSVVTVSIVTAFYTLLGLKLRRQNLVAGVLLGSLPALWLLALAAPGMSYLVSWPLLFAALPLAWLLLARGAIARPWVRVAVLAVAAVPAIVLVPGTLHQMTALAERFEGMLGVPALGMTMLFVAPVVALFVPHLHFLGGASDSWRIRWAVPAVAGVTAVALFGWAGMTSSFDAQHPRPDSVAYTLNADSNEARWVSFDQELDDFTRQFFPADVARGEYERLIYGATPAFTAAAPVAAIPPPEVTVLSETTDGEARTLRLRLTSPRGTTEMTTVVTAPGPIVAATVDGRTVDLGDYAPARAGDLTVIYANVPAGGWELTFTVRSTEPVTIALEEATDGLPDVPGMTIPERPAETMPSPLYARDATIVTRMVRY